MVDQRIDNFPTPVRPAQGIPRTGTATDRRPRRQEGEEKRNPKGQSRLKRQLFNLLFEEIDRVEELGPVQRERLKRNIRAHLMLQARQQEEARLAALQPSVSYAPVPAPALVPAPAPADDGETEDEPPSAAAADVPDQALPHDTLLGVAAPLHPYLPMDELEQNAMLAAQLRDCLSRHDAVAHKIATYLHLLLSVDGALDPHFVVDA